MMVLYTEILSLMYITYVIYIRNNYEYIISKKSYSKYMYSTDMLVVG